VWEESRPCTPAAARSAASPCGEPAAREACEPGLAADADVRALPELRAWNPRPELWPAFFARPQERAWQAPRHVARGPEWAKALPPAQRPGWASAAREVLAVQGPREPWRQEAFPPQRAFLRAPGAWPLRLPEAQPRPRGAQARV
jgi:hypothetical protein